MPKFFIVIRNPTEKNVDLTCSIILGSSVTSPEEDLLLPHNFQSLQPDQTINKFVRHLNSVFKAPSCKCRNLAVQPKAA